MATADLLPNATISTGWTNGTGNTHAEINSGVDTPTDGSYVAEVKANNSTSRFGFDATPGDFSSLNTLTVAIRSERLNRVDDNDRIDLSLYDDTGTQIGATKPFTPSDSGFTDQTATDSNWDSLNQTQLDGVEIDIVYIQANTGMPEATLEIRVSEMELRLDYDTGISDGEKMAAAGVAELTGAVPYRLVRVLPGGSAKGGDGV